MEVEGSCCGEAWEKAGKPLRCKRCANNTCGSEKPGSLGQEAQ